MKISLEWLKEYVNLPATVTAAELADKLTFAGLEVEGIEVQSKGLDKVVVGQIVERNQHPNADRLSLTKIDVGQKDLLEIVCGAQNIKAGQKVPVAMVGAVIPNGLEIKPAKIRNVPSQGMLCSLDELLLPKDWQAEDGIFILSPEAKLGTPIAEILGRNDSVLEIGVTPNRGDALSHYGVARDVAALYGLTAKLPEIKIEEKKGGRVVKIQIDTNKADCGQYMGRMIEGVKIAPSPQWLKKKVESIGLRSINNVVDVTSLVMMEMGQPLHAFDADLLGKNEVSISVRFAKEGEEFITLGDKTVKLLTSDILISAGAEKKGVALAGVMGGKNSEVSDSTKNVFLESADFDSVRVRKTGRRLGLLTDAGYRFERGVDPSKLQWAMDRASELIQKVAGGTVYAAVKAGTAPEAAPQLRLSVTEVQKLLGVSPDAPHMVQLFRGLGMAAEISAGEQGVVRVTVPHWRKDIKKAVDLVEEVARIWGFENVPSELPLSGLSGTEAKDSRRRSYFQVRRVRRHLASLGFYESLNYGFTSMPILEKAHSKEELASLVEVANPVTSDYSMMKPCLLTGLLENIQHNISHQQKNLRLFELRRVFQSLADKNPDVRTSTGVVEQSQIALAMTGDEVDKFWRGKPEAVDFYSLKGVVESVLEMLCVGGVRIEPGAKESFYHPGQSGTLMVGKKVLGSLGRVHPKVEKNFGIEQGIYFAQIDMDSLVSDEKARKTFKEFSKFPFVERDFSVEVSAKVTAQMLESLVEKHAKGLLKDFYFFDVYQGSRIQAGNVSYAFRLILGSEDHTLTDAEISGLQEKLMQELQKEFQAKFAGLS